MNVEIRPATHEDITILAEYNVALARETEGKELNLAVVTEGVRAVLDRPELGRYFVAELAGEPVGQLMITCEWSDWRNAAFWWIQSVYVRPDRRQHGVFRSLFRHVEATARALPGVCGIRLYVERHNEAAIATYRKLGMQPSGHTVFEIDWLLGETQDAPGGRASCPPLSR